MVWDIRNKYVLITGGTSGIGLETARQLAAMGARVYISGRNEEAAKQAIQQIGHGADYFLAEFSSQHQVRQLAGQVLQKLPQLDVLINNAGAVFPAFKQSDDGLEMTIATNHFAPFLLTHLLLPLLKQAPQARIVNVASDSHYQGKIDFESFTQNRSFNTMKAYGQSKLANVLFTVALAKRLPAQITANSLHPGVVKTHIGNKDMPAFMSAIWSLFTMAAGVPVEKGAATSVYLASSAEVEGVTGKYFAKCKEKRPSKLAQDAQLAEQLWEKSLQLCKL